VSVGADGLSVLLIAAPQHPKEPAAMGKHFKAAEIKIERAKRHLQELKIKIDQFFSRGSAAVVYEIAPEFGVINGAKTGAFTYREREPIPGEWSAIIGDILHNLRSSLDLIACDLHRITGGRPKDIKEVSYPFCIRRNYLSDTIKRRLLNRIGKDFLEIIEKTAPYKGGNDGLRAFALSMILIYLISTKLSFQQWPWQRLIGRFPLTTDLINLLPELPTDSG
jgi:hypothetical protein